MLGHLTKLFSPSKNGLRAMTFGDLPQVCRIIAETDEDDASEAQQSITNKNCYGMYVLEENSHIIGVIGANIDEDVGDIAWLSWTYIRQDKQSQGFGQFMMRELLQILDQQAIRKIFIMSSDYHEYDLDQAHDVSIYAAAHKFYLAAGAELELTIPDFHDTGESMLIYGLVNQGINKSPELRPDKPEGVHFGSISEASESEGGYALNWSVAGHEVTGLELAMQNAQHKSARIIVSSLPEDISQFCSAALTAHNFNSLGILKDYYDVGFDQVWWQKVI